MSVISKIVGVDWRCDEAVGSPILEPIVEAGIAGLDSNFEIAARAEAGYMHFWFLRVQLLHDGWVSWHCVASGNALGDLVCYYELGNVP